MRDTDGDGERRRDSGTGRRESGRWVRVKYRMCERSVNVMQAERGSREGGGRK